jgi:CHAT domain
VTEVSIMTVPLENATTIAPGLLLEERGIWRRTEPVLTGDDPQQARSTLNGALRAAVSPDADVDEPIAALVLPAMALYRAIVPKDLATVLAEAREADDGPPLLRIHLAPRYEWIPWEVLHDGVDFLGLRFQIARLPIVTHPPEQPADSVHPVHTVRSVLGRYVTDVHNGDFTRWKETFDTLLPDDAVAELTPPDEADQGWPQLNVLLQAADILHVTCHGLRDESGPYWTLDPRKPKATYAYTLTTDVVNALTDAFSQTRPLVFGNACAIDATAPADAEDRPPLATELFRTGALNFIGSLAPLRRELAILFARMFYEQLLGAHEPISHALLSAKQRCSTAPEGAKDPTYLFYCLYGPPETRYGAPGG